MFTKMMLHGKKVRDVIVRHVTHKVTSKQTQKKLSNLRTSKNQNLQRMRQSALQAGFKCRFTDVKIRSVITSLNVGGNIYI